jgi:hypothetical protein
MLLATLRARVYCTGLSLWLLSVGNLYPTQAQALKLNPFQPGIQLAPTSRTIPINWQSEALSLTANLVLPSIEFQMPVAQVCIDIHFNNLA